MKRIAIFQSELDVGGIQKSIVNLLNNIDYSRVEIDLFLSKKNSYWKLDFPKELNIYYLPEIPRVLSFLPFDIAKKLAELDMSDYGRYDLAIDFNSYQFSCALGAISVKADKRVMWVHNNVEIKLKNEWKYRVLWSAFKGKFKYYDEFVCVSGALIKPFEKMSGQHGKQFNVIQNYIDIKDVREKSKAEPENFEVDPACFNVVAVGRLCHQKGYDIMLDVFSKVYEQRKDIRLYIIGDGDELDTLKQQANCEGIADKVFFLGGQKNPFCYMKMMDAFVSTSRYEGQPLNIMEAIAVGLPVYFTKNLEQYTQGLTGYDDIVSALAAAEKQEKHPSDLAEYNSEIIEGVISLCDN